MTRTLVAFEIGATGQRIYVDPAHVYAVYDQPAATAAGEWRKLHAGVPVGAITNGRGEYWHLLSGERSAVIAVGTQALVVPYTADEVLSILFPEDVA